MGTVEGINLTERARLWAVATLRDVANRLEAAPPVRPAEAAIYLSPALAELERLAGMFLQRAGKPGAAG